MEREKVLFFLNIDKNAVKDKFLAKIVLGFNVGFTILVGGPLLLLPLSSVNIAIVLSFIVADFLLAVIFAFYKNPAWQFLIEGIGYLLVTVKLLLGYSRFSQDQHLRDGSSIFTWVHLMVFLLSFWLAVWVLYKQYQAYQILKKHSLSIAIKKINKKNRRKEHFGYFFSPVMCSKYLISYLFSVG